MAIRVDFHIVKKNRAQALYYLAQLIETIYHEDKKIMIATENEQVSNELDELLWSYLDDSFLPHEIMKTNEPVIAPIQISDTQLAPYDVLVNLRSTIPASLADSTKIIEIVYQDKVATDLSRQKYRQYQNRACQLQTFHID